MTAKKRNNNNKVSSSIIKALWAIFAIAIAAIVILFVAIFKGWIGYMPPIEDLQNPKDKFASQIYSDDG